MEGAASLQQLGKTRLVAHYHPHVSEVSVIFREEGWAVFLFQHRTEQVFQDLSFQKNSSFSCALGYVEMLIFRDR